jgi:hypothetical protein
MKREILVMALASFYCLTTLPTNGGVSHVAQARRANGTIDGTVVDANQSIHSIDVTVEANGSRYTFCVACQGGGGPELIGIDNVYTFADRSAVGTRLRVTYTKVQRFKSQGAWMYSVDAKRVVKLDGRANAPAQTSSNQATDWNTFWTNFRAAVRRRDRRTLKTMMIRDFEWSFGLYPPGDHRDTLFRSLDRYHNWTTLDRVLTQGTVPHFENGKEFRVARLDPAYGAWRAGFERGSDGRWRWTFLVSGD